MLTTVLYLQKPACKRMRAAGGANLECLVTSKQLTNLVGPLVDFNTISLLFWLLPRSPVAQELSPFLRHKALAASQVLGVGSLSRKA